MIRASKLGVEPQYEHGYSPHSKRISLRERRTVQADAGGSLQPVTCAYALYGELNEARDNALLSVMRCPVRRASPTGGRSCSGRINPLIPTHYCVIGVNVIGSCYGSTGPCSPHPQKPGQLYGSDFPVVTIRDMVRTQARVA